jgi:ATP-binding cassette subfamily B protein
VVVTSGLQSITPYFFKLFVDAIPALNYQNLMHILFIYMGISVLSLTIDVISGWLGDVVLLDAARDAREEIFKHVQSLDFSFHSNKSTGSLISAFKRGDGAFFDMFQTFHFNFLNVFVTTLVMVYFFTKINAPIAITMVISLVVALIAIRLLIKNNVKKRNVFNDQEDNVSAIITDNMMNYETVKLFAREKWEEKRLSDAFVDWTKTLWGYANSFRLIDIVVGGITSISIFLTFFLALYFTVNLKLSVGDFVMVVGFVGIFFPKIWNLVYGTRSIAKNYADIEKYFGLLDEKVEVLDPEKPVKVDHVFGEINFDKVYFTYNGRTKNAINGINLTIEQGESVALVGRSGSGKTTLAKLLMRFYDLDSGEIDIDGINIKDFTKDTLRSFVGVVPQEPILFNNTIKYNIGYGYKGRTLKGGSEKGPTLSEVRAAAHLANIDEFIDSLKLKYDTEVGERGVKLSGGQKQRIAIARMILSDPDIVVFDEATSNLDSESEKLIQDAFWKARIGKTTIIIAHRLSTVMRADKIVVMESGKIREIGTHRSLLKDENSLYSHFWNLQIKLD